VTRVEVTAGILVANQPVKFGASESRWVGRIAADNEMHLGVMIKAKRSNICLSFGPGQTWPPYRVNKASQFRWLQACGVSWFDRVLD
jgi:hypothetical protein